MVLTFGGLRRGVPGSAPRDHCYRLMDAVMGEERSRLASSHDHEVELADHGDGKMFDDRRGTSEASHQGIFRPPSPTNSLYGPARHLIAGRAPEYSRSNQCPYGARENVITDEKIRPPTDRRD